MGKSMELNVQPRWDEIEKVRNKSEKFLQSKGLSNEMIYSLTMVISELVENSVKYGKFIQKNNKVMIKIDIEKTMITIEVINPVDNTTYKDLERLDKTIQWIRGYQDPFEAYVERLKEVSKRPLKDQESGLGLVRVAYEGKAILDFFLGENDILNVSAVSNL